MAFKDKAEGVAVEAAANVLLTSVAVYFPLMALLWLLFELLRRRFKTVFAPENHADFPEGQQGRLLAWVPFLWRLSEERVAEDCGLDAWVLLRFMKMGQKVAALGIACALALLPMYFFTAAVVDADDARGVNVHRDADGTGVDLPFGLNTSLDAASWHFVGMGNVVGFSVGGAGAGLGSVAAGNVSTPPERVRLDFVDRLTIANVGSDDWRLYFTVLTAYILSGYLMHLLQKEYTIYRKRRHDFLGRRHAQQYSIVISDLPHALRRPQTLLDYMSYLFPDAVHSVYIGVECGELEDLLDKREDVAFELYAAREELAAKERKQKEAMEAGKASESDSLVAPHPTTVVGRKWWANLLCCCAGKAAGEKVDAIEYYTNELAKVEADVVSARESIIKRQAEQGVAQVAATTDIQEAQDDKESRFAAFSKLADKLRRTKSSMDEDRWAKEKVLGVTVAIPKGPNVMRSCAFVTFHKIRSAQSAQQLLQVENPLRMRVRAAPNIRDVLWKNFGLPHKLKSKWKLFSMVATFLIVCFWTVPTAFVASMASVDELQHTFTWMQGALERHPWLLAALQQTAPLVYSIMNNLANGIFKLLATQEGHLSISEVDASLFTKLCVFQVFQMFFVAAVAGSIITELFRLIDQPRLVFFFLGSTIANQSMTFITFTITQCCVDMSLFLLRVSPVLIDLCYRIVAPKSAKLPTPKDWMGIYPINFCTDLDPAYNLAQQYLVFVFLLVFAPIAPLISVFAGFFFVTSEIAYKRYFFFVNRHRWATTNSMGVFWPPLYQFIVGALLVAQATLIGLLSLKSAGYGPIVISCLLPFGTLCFHWYAVSLSGLPRAAANLPLDKCCDIDDDRRNDTFDFLDNVYQQPAMAESMHPASLESRNATRTKPGANGLAPPEAAKEAAVDAQAAAANDAPKKPVEQQTRLAELNAEKSDEDDAN
jgi:hypothetical protein